MNRTLPLRPTITLALRSNLLFLYEPFFLLNPDHPSRRAHEPRRAHLVVQQHLELLRRACNHGFAAWTHGIAAGGHGIAARVYGCTRLRAALGCTSWVELLQRAVEPMPCWRVLVRTVAGAAAVGVDAPITHGYSLYYYGYSVDCSGYSLFG